MQLRRFTADSTPAALGAVRLALGEDAIILANRKIGEQVEIIATGQMEDAQSLADMSVETVSQPSTTNVNVREQHNSVKRESADAHAEEAPGRASASTSFDELTAAIDDAVGKEVEPVRQAASKKPNSTTHVTATSVSGSASSKGHDTRNSMSAETRYADIDDSYQRSDLLSLSSEFDGSVARHTEQLSQIINAQSVMINEYFKALEVNLWGNNAPNRTVHLQRLFSLGIGAELAINLVERSNPEHSIDDALRHSFSLLKSTLPIGVDKTFSVPGITIFSGLPGAGKTTALMKIATQHVKEQGSDSIVIICADTRRIGAFEELQAYGRLLGVPTVHAHDSFELDSLLGAFTHKRLVLIDHTLPMDSDAVELPKRLLFSDGSNSVRQLLVLSATAQSVTIDALLSQHCEGRSMHCVLTHLDANARLGEMFNAIIRHHLPIAYWSDNASVQNPLQKAEASVLIATAAAMSRRLRQTPDDEWLLRLVQPSDQMMPKSPYKTKNKEVCA